MTAEIQFGPKCNMCGRKDPLDKYQHELWLQVVDNSDCVNNPEGSARINWVCPECLEKTRIVSEYKQSNEDLHHGLEEAGKIMELLASLGFAIDKAKQNQAVGNKK